jgi:protein-S-isoprenylcysteine O-methyltransferase Ste14
MTNNTNQSSPDVTGATGNIKTWPSTNDGPWQKTLRIFRHWRVKLPRVLGPLLLAHYILSNCTPLALWPLSAIGVKAGVAMGVILAGIAIRIWSRGHHVQNTLYTNGPYALVQHPLYLGTFLISYGVCLILNDWLITVVYLAYFFVFYSATILSEEISMYNKFGQVYSIYFSKTPSIIPYRFSSIHLKDLGGWSFAEFRKTTELRSSLLYLCIPVVLVLFSNLVAALQTWRHS